ncbi:hypothetical protein JVT61DRAFT_9055 [Boletus reticuloceps]|uniref:Uncharacterized protein n=1 Tax=Boletus reticuloceps TaxID=495285 RepID=A0A8I3A2W0_9AGAM|nr:hypothetical protein JVT61DRAFT_12580 [Boletus reticuloceps]KAG6371711.1 hypothetical protein JVT61DRAFT_9055 [Boletus reticuloceps]
MADVIEQDVLVELRGRKPDKLPDGILEAVVTNPCTSDQSASTGVAVDHLLLRKGAADNITVLPDWQLWTDSVELDKLGRHDDNFQCVLHVLPFLEFGTHLFIDWSRAATGASVVVHTDLNHSTQQHVPQHLACGPFNDWGYDQGILAAMNQTGDGI